MSGSATQGGSLVDSVALVTGGGRVNARRSSCMAARLAPRCVVGCGRRGYERCGEGGQAGLRRRVGQQHVTTPSLRQKTEYHERDQLMSASGRGCGVRDVRHHHQARANDVGENREDE